MAAESRFDRQERLFGREGQQRIEAVRVAIVGLGGLGSHVNQQLAYLGVRELALIDSDVITPSSLNRVVGAALSDLTTPAMGMVSSTRKVDVAERLLKALDPSIEPRTVPYDFRSKEGFDAIKESDVVFGCIDDDVARIALTELCAAYEKRYFDLATDTGTDEFGVWFGGRVAVASGDGCVVCLDLVDQEAMRRKTMTEGERAEDARIYGVPTAELGDEGPSVVSLNAVVASLAVMEFMVAATGLRDPRRLLEYDGRRGIVTVSKDRPKADCFYCKGAWGNRDEAGVERFLRPRPTK